MKVEFWLRKPGNYHMVAEADLPAVPREGDAVSLDGNTAWDVHSVTWLIQEGVARVWLKD